MKRLIAAAVAALMLTACGNSAEPTAANADYIYGKIESVSGNDIVLLMADYNEQASADDSGSSDDKKASGKPKREKTEGDDSAADGSGKTKRERPENFDPENMPEGFDPSKFGGERPERSDSEGDGSSKTKRERPEGFDPSKFGGERPERGSSKDDTGSADSGNTDKKKPSGSGRSGGKYTLTGETEELRIPVGTTVTTSAGVKTDFDALSAGDMIKCSVEKNAEGQDVITEVWILES